MTVRDIRATGPVVLVAAVFVATVELVRAASPLLDQLTGDWGVVGAALLAVVIFGGPALIGPLTALIGPARATAGLVAALVVLRLAAQARPTLVVVGLGAAVGIGALVLALRRAVTTRSGVAAAVGVLLGTVVDQAVRAAYGTWDPVFRPGVLPWVLVVALAGVTVAALVASPPAAGDAAAGGRVGAVGPYLALYILIDGSAAFVASQAGVSSPVASGVLIATAVVSLELLRRLTLPGASGAVPEPDRWYAGSLALLAVAGGAAVAYVTTGPVVLAAVVVTGLAAAVALARALTPVGSEDTRRGPSLTLAGLAAGFGYVLPVMLFQTHYELEFPFDNRYLPVVAAVLLGVAGTGRRPSPAAGQRGGLLTRPALSSVLAALTLLVPLGMAVTAPPVPESRQTGSAVRLLSWNVRYGRDATGRPDPETIAATIEREAPDVVLLQEVSRGWPIGGATDLAEWLSRRLAMRYEWSPAADGQFGNVILTRMPYSEVTARRLPFVEGPMQRSFLGVTLHLTDGGELRIIDAHLQHRKQNTRTRLVQSEALLAEWAGGPRTVIAGDFNFWPSWPEPQVFFAAGFQSAQDATGHGAEFTTVGGDRVDWIFGTPDLTFSDFVIRSDVTTSDHHPLVVTVTPA